MFEDDKDLFVRDERKEFIKKVKETLKYDELDINDFDEIKELFK